MSTVDRAHPFAPKRQETALKAQLREQFEAGKAAAEDPTNADLPDLYLRTTTIYSRWYTRICPECKHTFREGDKVRQCPLCGQAYHDDAHYGLHCWQKHFTDKPMCKIRGYNRVTEITEAGCAFTWDGGLPDAPTDEPTLQVTRVPQITAQFQTGLHGEWQAFGKVEVIEVPSGSPLVGRPCPFCRFNIRAGDRVVKCPCGKCDAHFHADLFRHLTCWNAWNGSDGSDHCPTTGAPIARPPVGEHS